MRDFRDAKTMAATLRDRLAAEDHAMTQGRALEVVAAMLGCRDWNTLAAAIGDREAPRFTETCPILRIFDEAKAREFYLDWLGFAVDWEHRFAPGMPLYLQVSRAGLVLHLSMHHGDASPGATVFVRMRRIRAFHAEIMARPYAHNRPGLESAPWGLQVEVTDPFMNRIRFCEQE
jgi:hypothetical protein